MKTVSAETALWQALLMLAALFAILIYESLPPRKSRVAQPKPAKASTGIPSVATSSPDALPPFYVGRFTAYTSRTCETDESPYITADGTDLRSFPRCVAANNVLPFGTVIFVEGIGECEIRDRMNVRYGPHRFDLYFGKDVEKAIRFGERQLKYFFL